MYIVEFLQNPIRLFRTLLRLFVDIPDEFIVPETITFIDRQLNKIGYFYQFNFDDKFSEFIDIQRDVYSYMEYRETHLARFAGLRRASV